MADNPPSSGPDARPAADANTIPDRRRPGRVAYANPHLVRLLRKPAEPREITVRSEDEMQAGELPRQDPDNLGAARGILLALGIGGVFWAAFAAILWLLIDL